MAVLNLSTPLPVTRSARRRWPDPVLRLAGKLRRVERERDAVPDGRFDDPASALDKEWNAAVARMAATPAASLPGVLAKLELASGLLRTARLAEAATLLGSSVRDLRRLRTAGSG